MLLQVEWLSIRQMVAQYLGKDFKKVEFTVKWVEVESANFPLGKTLEMA